ncbi:MAG: oxygen-dependent coproporphyrinogen oxidase [Gracilimonas sp.]|uniref:oxygen-dependent coproporphyrinogen oxidase n=1 Tax=Gracilimonas TaxID=649462 RepID=UPI001AFE1C30|nr:oxygen-dependent coproporphyrinogen oxidase [Gracilimonas sp.]MBO6585621.1 oxygen-dependent coproporphyrinogen oxidase [Gracilimonas sp.]MBO6616618.1 oxygen-dependent coproporphyrinogen oxidase [Gracilimonas sp.]
MDTKLTSKKEEFSRFVKNVQQHICDELEAVDGTQKFRIEDWEREGFGGGSTRIIAGGNVIEKGGVNVSAVGGPLPEAMQKKFEVPESEFFATGVSLVIHPQNPFVPTVHANYRYFELYDKDTGELKDQWFGGGADMTPYYLFAEDANHFHQVHKEVCDRFNPDYYPDFKAECDAYFYNHHREEARGIGGLFFDYQRPDKNRSADDLFEFCKAAGFAFTDAYVPIIKKRKDDEFSQEHRDWQEIRRGRYVEFNLIHDRGTLFGLKTKGRIESILMSLPPKVQWVYDHHPEPGSPEAELVDHLKPIDWINYS